MLCAACRVEDAKDLDDFGLMLTDTLEYEVHLASRSSDAILSQCSSDSYRGRDGQSNPGEERRYAGTPFL